MVALRIIEEEIYSLRQQYQALKDLVYLLSTHSKENRELVERWVRFNMPKILEANKRVDSHSDIKTFVLNVLRDTKR